MRTIILLVCAICVGDAGAEKSKSYEVDDRAATSPYRGPSSLLPEGLKVFIATPAYGGMTTVDYTTAVVKMVTQLREVAWNLKLTAGESIVTVGRNNMVMEFLKSDCTHLLFLDADLAFEVETIRSLLALDEDVALVPYPTKQYNEERMQQKAEQGKRPAKLSDGLHFNLHVQPDQMIDALENERRYVEVDAGPTGCMLIKRQVFTKMMRAYPELEGSITGASGGVMYSYTSWWRFFDTMMSETNEFIGEDFAFCKRWRAIGGKIYADMKSTMWHVGRNAFAGSLSEFLLG